MSQVSLASGLGFVLLEGLVIEEMALFLLFCGTVIVVFRIRIWVAGLDSLPTVTWILLYRIRSQNMTLRTFGHLAPPLAYSFDIAFLSQFFKKFLLLLVNLLLYVRAVGATPTVNRESCRIGMRKFILCCGGLANCSKSRLGSCCLECGQIKFFIPPPGVSR